MADTFDAVLAEVRQVGLIGMPDVFDRLAAAHAAEKSAWFLRAREEAERCGQAEARAEAAERDARRWLAMREHMVAVDWKPEMGGGPVVMFECMAERVMAGPEGADAIADAAVEYAAIVTTEQAAGGLVRDGGE